MDRGEELLASVPGGEQVVSGPVRGDPPVDGGAGHQAAVVAVQQAVEPADHRPLQTAQDAFRTCRRRRRGWCDSPSRWAGDYGRDATPLSGWLPDRVGGDQRVQAIESDLEAYYDRRKEEKFQRILKEMREFYNLERLWGDAPQL